MGYPRHLTRVRFVQGSGFEMQCPTCEIYVPLVESEWYPKSGLTRCRSCWTEYKRLHEAGRQHNEIIADLKRTRARLRYRFNREERLAKNKEWRERNREHVAAYNKAYRERNKEHLAAKQAEYVAECRDVILLKKRQRYYDKKVAAA